MNRRGFTLVETAIAVAVLAVLVAVAIPVWSSMQHESRFSGATRELVGTLRKARSHAVSGATLPSAGAGARVRSAGLRFDSDQRIVVYLDPDEDPANGNQVDLETIDLAADDPQRSIRLVSPGVGSVVTFRRDGSTNATPFVLRDLQNGRQRSFQLTAAGSVAME
jgi:prepilin-type N-terminal cleavage/methylation domain-containing protein